MRIFLLILLASLPARAADVVIDPAQRFQTITGWEATLDLSDTPARPGWGAYREALLDRAVSEMGLTRVRLEVRAGAESRSGMPARFIAGRIDYPTYKASFYKPDNDNADPFSLDMSGFDFSEMDWHVEQSLLPLKRRLEARGERLFVNLHYVSFARQPYLHSENPEEYAEFILAATLHLKQKWGITPDLWEAVLEPDNKRVNGPWSPQKVAAAIAAAGKRLKAAGFAPAFSAPSVTDPTNTLRYLNAILANPQAAAVMREVSYHRYYKPKGQLPQIARTAARAGLTTAMTEWWNNRADIEVLIRDLTVGNVSAWQGNALSGHWRTPQRGRLELKPVNRVRRLIFRDVRPGAVRIGAEASTGDIGAVAFALPGGGRAAFVHVKRATEVTLHGLKPGPALLSFEGRGKKRGPSQDRVPINVPDYGRVRVQIPSSGLVAIVSR